MSPTWAVRSEQGVEGCQKGVGVGVEIRATEQVEPPRKRWGPPIWVFEEGMLEGWAGEPRMSEAFRGASVWMGSSLRGEALRAWAEMKSRSAVRKA